MLPRSVFRALLVCHLLALCVCLAPQCNLNGVINGDGACVCDQGWRGADCGELSVSPGPANLGYHNTSSGVGASWGANAVFSQGLWHAFVAEMTLNCTLNEYGSNSGIIRATSPSVGGPYTYAETVIAPFAHNPTIRELPNGTGYLLFMIGGTPSTQQDCRMGTLARRLRTSSTDDPSGIAVSYAPTVLGPWSHPTRVEFSHYNTSALLNCAFTNPSPSILPNGSVLLAFQGGYCHSIIPGIGEEDIGVALAPSWNATYALVTGAPIATLPPWCVAGLGEDPFLYRNSRGEFHMLIHGMCFATFNAIHAFSEDGVAWSLSPTPPYSYMVNYSGAAPELYWRVERPQLVLDPATAAPLALFNGVCADGLACLGNPGKTFTLARLLS